MAPTDPVVSHGRGGTGNIGSDDTKYVDGEITREGPAGEGHTGRGGQGNLVPPSEATARKSTEVIPDAATRPSQDNVEYHVGRGGAANVHHPENGASPVHRGLADKLKNKLFGKK